MMQCGLMLTEGCRYANLLWHVQKAVVKAPVFMFDR